MQLPIESVPHVRHDYFFSFNQSNHWFVVLSLPLPSSFLKLPISFGRVCRGDWLWNPANFKEGSTNSGFGVEYQLGHRPVFFSSCWCYFCMCNIFNKEKDKAFVGCYTNDALRCVVRVQVRATRASFPRRTFRWVIQRTRSDLSEFAFVGINIFMP